MMNTEVQLELIGRINQKISIELSLKYKSLNHLPLLGE